MDNGRGVLVRKRWLYALVGALAVEVGFALLVRLDELSAFALGEHSFTSTVAVIGLGWLIVLVLIAERVMASLMTARRDLYMREQALTAAATSSPDWLWETDTSHRLTYCSEGVRHILGYAPEELVGRFALELVPDYQYAAAERLMRQCVETATGWSEVEMSWRRNDGEDVVLQGSASPICDEHGQVMGIRGTRRRVTDAEVAQRRVVVASQRISEVVTSQALDIALQPIVDLSTGRLAGVEALARFRDGRGPDLWFRDAHDTGQSLDLDRLAFCAALALLPQLPVDCYLSINATPELLLSGQLVRDVLDHPECLERLVVEITEHAQIGSYDDLRAALAPIRERGVRLAIDDTGAGYASLAHVLQLNPDIIKIDRSLVANVNSDPTRRSLVTALVMLALNLDASVTGEGVETSEEMDTLTSLGVTNGQGYLLARPTIDPRRWKKWDQRDWLDSSPAAKIPAAKTTRGGTSIGDICPTCSNSQPANKSEGQRRIKPEGQRGNGD